VRVVVAVLALKDFIAELTETKLLSHHPYLWTVKRMKLLHDEAPTLLGHPQS